MAGSSSKRKPRRAPSSSSGGSSSPHDGNYSNTRRKLNGDEVPPPMPASDSANGGKKVPADIADVLGLKSSVQSSQQRSQSSQEQSSPVEPVEVQSASVATAHVETLEDSTIPSAIDYHSPHPALPMLFAQKFYSRCKDLITEIVVQKFFPEVKFVNKQFEMGWDDSPQSFCQFFIVNCNVPPEAGHRSWWAMASRVVSAVLCQTRNDRTTAVKYAFVGKYIVALLISNTQTLTMMLLLLLVSMSLQI